MKELRERKIPFTIRRYLPDGRYALTPFSVNARWTGKSLHFIVFKAVDLYEGYVHLDGSIKEMPHCIGAVTKTGVLTSWLLKIHGGDKWVVDAPLCSCHCPTWLPNEHHVVCCSSRTGDGPVAWKFLRGTDDAPKKLHCVFIMLHAWICAFCKLETIWFCIRPMIAYEIWDSITFLTSKTIALTSNVKEFLTYSIVWIQVHTLYLVRLSFLTVKLDILLLEASSSVCKHNQFEALMIRSFLVWWIRYYVLKLTLVSIIQYGNWSS